MKREKLSFQSLKAWAAVPLCVWCTSCSLLLQVGVPASSTTTCGFPWPAPSSAAWSCLSSTGGPPSSPTSSSWVFTSTSATRNQVTDALPLSTLHWPLTHWLHCTQSYLRNHHNVHKVLVCHIYCWGQQPQSVNSKPEQQKVSSSLNPGHVKIFVCLLLLTFSLFTQIEFSDYSALEKLDKVFDHGHHSVAASSELCFSWWLQMWTGAPPPRPWPTTRLWLTPCASVESRIISRTSGRKPLLALLFQHGRCFVFVRVSLSDVSV